MNMQQCFGAATIAFCVAVFASGDIHSQSPSITSTEVTTRPIVPAEDRQWSYRHAYGILLEIPSPMSRQEIDRHRDILSLSAEQCVLQDKLFDQYQSQCDQLERDYRDIFRDQATLVSSQPRGPVHARDYAELRITEEQFIATLIRHEEDLFNKLAAGLSDNQLPELPRVREHRARNRCMTGRREIAKERADLASLVEQGFPPDTLADVDELLVDYEKVVTPAFLETELACRTAEPLLVSNAAKMLFHDDGTQRSGSDPAFQEESRQLASQYKQILATRLAPMKEVCRINDEYLPKLVQALPKTDADRLRALYLAKCYPQVYPDSLYPEPIHQRFLELPDISEDVVTAAQELWSSYQRNYDRLNTIMREEFDRRQLQMAATWSLNGRKKHEELISSSLLDRVEASELFVKQLLDLVPTSADHVSLAGMLTDWRQESQRVKDRARGGQPGRS